MNNIGVLVLAAGESSRLGEPKQLLKWGNVNLLEHTLHQLKTVDVSTRYVVLGAHAAKIKSEVDFNSFECLEYKDWSQGMGSTLSYALAEMPLEKLDGLLILLCDQPGINDKYLDEMLTVFVTSTKGMVATQYANTIGVPLLVSKKYFDALKGLQGERGAKKIIQEHLDDVVVIPNELGALDIDTQDVYRMVVSQLLKP